MKNIGVITLVSWIVTMLTGFFGIGGFALERMQNLSGKVIPFEMVYVTVALALVSIVLTVLWARSLGSGQLGSEQLDSGQLDSGQQGTVEPSSRRKFLLGGAAVTGGVAGVAGMSAVRISDWLQTTIPALTEAGIDVATAPMAHESWSGARIVSKRPLGNTGFLASDIAIGTTMLNRHADPEGLLREVLDRGVNYIDTSPDYAGAEAEQTVGNVIKDRNREELFIVTKWCSEDGHTPPGSSVDDYLAALDASLARLQTDYVDLMHVHNCWSIERLMDPNLHTAFEMAKEQGKVRFLGMSSHSPNLEEVATKAIDSGKFDVLMLAYHHGAWPKQKEIIKKAATAGVGIVAMKTLKGAKHRGLMALQNEETSYTQAAFKWVNSNPDVSNLVVSFFDTQHLDEYLHASGKQLTQEDLAVLDKYDNLIAGTHCFQNCGDCLGACPESLPINDVLRHRMYFEDYGDQKEAMRLYSHLDNQADKCLTCAAPCTGACPEGIDIKERMVGAHQRLTMTA